MAAGVGVDSEDGVCTRESEVLSSYIGFSLVTFGPNQRCRNMPHLSWTDMMTEYPAGHLVVGIVDGESAVQPASLVSQLLERSKVKGDYAVEAVTKDNVPLVQSVFAKEEDADKFAEAIGADVVSRHPAWATQRTFRLDSELCEEISSALKSAK